MKGRSNAGDDWFTYSATTGNTKNLYVNGAAAAGVYSTMWNDTSLGTTSFAVGSYASTNGSGRN